MPKWMNSFHHNVHFSHILELSKELPTVILLNVGKNFKTPITLLLTTPELGSLTPLENVDAKVDEQLSS